MARRASLASTIHEAAALTPLCAMRVTPRRACRFDRPCRRHLACGRRMTTGTETVIAPGPRNSLTDVAGLLVGSAEDRNARTGVTVVLPDATASVAVDVRGGAAGTINTAGLALGGLIREGHGIVLSGGSAFGLEAATGPMARLSARGRGFGDWGTPVPLVSGALLFDLMNGGDKTRGGEPAHPPPAKIAGAILFAVINGGDNTGGEGPPSRRLAKLAAEAAGREVRLGNAGAGYGAGAGPLKGGLGTASAVDEATGITLAALVAANPVGSV